jgi:alginate lyase
VRYALTQPVTRHALEVDAFAVAGSAPVRRGIAVVAVVGGALSVAGSTLAPTPQPPEPADTHADPAAIGLTAQSKQSKADDEDSDDDDPVLDADAVKKTVQKAKEEGSRLAAEDKKSRDDEDEDEDDDAAAAASPSSGAAARGGDASMPADLIDTNDWYLTLPTGKKGSPDTIDGSKLASYHSKFFELNDQRNGIVFTANAGGVTTSGSHYPRSELREMEGEKKASWDGRKGTHTMELDQAITAAPSAKPDVIAGQIHGTSDDLMQIHLSGKQLTVKYGDGKKKVVLDDDYKLGTRFTTKIESSGGHVKVWYNGQQKADLAINSSTSYFKAGAYVNCNTSKGASASDIGQVVVYKADVTHSGSAAKE